MTEKPRSRATRADLDAERFEIFQRMWRSGAAIGLPAALHHCVEYKAAAPAWLLEALLDLLCDLLKREKSTKRGRSGGHLARFRQDMVDFARWDAVLYARRNQEEIQRQVETMRTFPDVPKSYSEDREKLLDWLGSTADRAYECAAMLLEGTSVYATPDAMKKSYLTVERNLKSRREACRYFVLDYPLLTKLGMEPFGVVRPGKPVVPLYEVTL